MVNELGEARHLRKLRGQSELWNVVEAIMHGLICAAFTARIIAFAENAVQVRPSALRCLSVSPPLRASFGVCGTKLSQYNVVCFRYSDERIACQPYTCGPSGVAASFVQHEATSFLRIIPFSLTELLLEPLNPTPTPTPRHPLPVFKSMACIVFYIP